MNPRHSSAWRPYICAPDTRLADAIARVAELEAENERLRRRLGDDVRRQAGLDERRRERWVTP